MCFHRTLCITVILVCSASMVAAQEKTPDPASAAASKAPAQETPSAYDRIWKRATEWYIDDSNPVVQKVLFSGRFQEDYASVRADQGDFDGWNVRRMRLGPRITLFRTWTLHTEVELNPQERDPFYVRLTDFYLQWNKSSRVALTFGKQGVPFTMDGSTSSKELIALDRSPLTNNIWFTSEYMPGVAVSGKAAPWMYRGGIYSAGRANREFGEFSGDWYTLGVLGYDFAKTLGVKEALLSGNYVYQPADADNTFTRPFQNIGSVNFKLEGNRWGLRGDVSGADGYDNQPNVWGVMAMPYVNITSKLQLVGRYTLVGSDGPNGVRLGTYENEIVSGRGDHLNEGYAGANYFFYGHKLKLQTGITFTDMQDSADDGGEYSGVSWVSGLRIGW